jgi:hypothetical protein
MKIVIFVALTDQWTDVVLLLKQNWQCEKLCQMAHFFGWIAKNKEPSLLECVTHRFLGGGGGVTRHF